MERAVTKGNASAGKWQPSGTTQQLEGHAQVAPSQAPGPETLGKKEVQREAAARVTGKFARPSPPPTKHLAHRSVARQAP